jgi:hypothetical protein
MASPVERVGRPSEEGGTAALSPLWQRAAVLGSLWAASEIALGSFLHNLRVPFAGHALTAIAVAVLVAGHRTWPQEGLLVRAGLIAAVMKSTSPSAVLFGPMVAIVMEGWRWRRASGSSAGVCPDTRSAGRWRCRGRSSTRS